MLSPLFWIPLNKGISLSLPFFRTCESNVCISSMMMMMMMLMESHFDSHSCDPSIHLSLHKCRERECKSEITCHVTRISSSPSTQLIVGTHPNMAILVIVIIPPLFYYNTTLPYHHPFPPLLHPSPAFILNFPHPFISSDDDFDPKCKSDQSTSFHPLQVLLSPLFPVLFMYYKRENLHHGSSDSNFIGIFPSVLKRGLH